MLLNTFKWLSWLAAVALVVVLFLATVLTGRLGMAELIITLMFAGIISLPGWLIHSVQKQKRSNAV
jgi:hypothetical protein